MRIVDDLPHQVVHRETEWIPVAPDVRLAARTWRPVDATDEPVPAILEFLPYRRRDTTRERDDENMPYLAGHGYACLRVDLRGSGDSDGVLLDEYLVQEQDDAIEVIRWIADQPWCDGEVGMMGISWGGFNGLQVAARQPDALGAVVSCSSTDDRYADDVHYMGGCLLGDNLSWASVMYAFNSTPPDPDVVGDRWRDMWLERLEAGGHWLETWLRHQRRDGYWQHGSICEAYDDVQVPVLLASGWADGYSNAIFRMLEHLDCPRRGLIGPWSHVYPHTGVPGPRIGFLQEVVRWFDHWLKGVDRGVEDDPVLRVWMQDSVPPHPSYDQRPGRWVAEDTWPPPVEDREVLELSRSAELVPQGEARPFEVSILSPLSVGLFAGKWCSYAAPPDLPHDQREEDGGSLVFQTDRLREPLELLGAPVVEVELRADRPVAMVAARLSDIAPDGEATRVTYGLRNLTHRDGHDQPAPLEPGETYRVRIRLNDIAQRFPAGHAVRLSLSTSYFPQAWPPPEPATITVSGGELALPVRRPRDTDLRDLGAPEIAPPTDVTVLDPGEERWEVVRDLAADVSRLEVVKDDGVRRIEEIDLEVGRSARETYGYARRDVTSVVGEVTAVRTFRREGWDVRTETFTRLTCDAEAFHLHATLDAYEDGERIHSQVINERIERHLV